MARHIHVHLNADEWSEGDHPRGEGGKFGGEGTSATHQEEYAEAQKHLKLSREAHAAGNRSEGVEHMAKHNEHMGNAKFKLIREKRKSEPGRFASSSSQPKAAPAAEGPKPGQPYKRMYGSYTTAQLKTNAGKEQDPAQKAKMTEEIKPVKTGALSIDRRRRLSGKDPSHSCPPEPRRMGRGEAPSRLQWRVRGRRRRIGGCYIKAQVHRTYRQRQRNIPR